MITHYFTLNALCGELTARLQGTVVEDSFTQQKDELVVVFKAVDGEPAVIINVEPSANALFWKDGFARAKRNSVTLFEPLRGAALESVSMSPGERIVKMRFSGGWTLAMRLFNTVRSNIFLIDGSGTVIESFKSREDRSKEEEPRTDGTTFQIIPLPADFSTRVKAKPEADIVTALKKAAPVFGTIYAREAVHRAGLNRDTNVAELSDAAIAELHGAATEIAAEQEQPRSLLYETDNGPLFSIIALQQFADAASEEFPDVNTGVRRAIARSRTDERTDGERERIGDQLERIAHTTRKSLDAASAQARDAERAAEFEANGTLLMAHLADLAQLPKGTRQVTLTDIVAGHGERTIALDPFLTPVKNAERFFEKAKKAKAAQKELEERVVGLQEKAILLAGMLEKLQTAPTGEAIKEFTATYRRELRELRIAESAPKPQGKSASGVDSGDANFPFRRFSVFGGFEVWVGKNSANNDLLTMKYARPNDYWFHARGSSGSHTVLRVNDSSAAPPREAVLAAAAIAAYYSKMRNAGSVPVAYCERKYVRKGKGLAEGAVYMDREKVVMVKPRLPE